jgi:membrane dipeptidase
MPGRPDKALRAAYRSSYGFREKIDTDGFDRPLKIYDLTEELIRRKYSDGDIKLILGGNFRRLLGATCEPRPEEGDARRIDFIASFDISLSRTLQS